MSKHKFQRKTSEREQIWHIPHTFFPFVLESAAKMSASYLQQPNPWTKEQLNWNWIQKHKQVPW